VFTMENRSVLCFGIKHKEFSFLGLFSVVSKHFPYLALMDLNWGVGIGYLCRVSLRKTPVDIVPKIQLLYPSSRIRGSY